MANWQERTQIMVGADGLERLRNANVLVAGVGGVGSYAVEQLVRAGIGNITLVDADVVNPSNRNRQLPALISTETIKKVEVVKQRCLDINPELNITTYDIFLKEELIPELIDFQKYDFVVDAIDTLSPKVYLIFETVKRNIPLISSMGAGGKLDPSKISITDISKSYHCNLARMVRKRLHKLNIHKGFSVVFSPEEVDDEMIIHVEGEQNKKTTVGTISYMPAMFGCYVGSHVIRNLLHK
ncbi:MAG: tRNA threonylcarbamoyladenosine dehydratase [Breznakibacter sp.]|nr:tRNA threonylcarbamoyladenosine dehydratase [Breznakibacter sp.]